MLNQRQIEIIIQMFDTPDAQHTTSDLAAQRGVSMRTIQMDLKVIRETLLAYSCISFTSDRRGSFVRVLDPAGFEELKEKFILECAEYTNAQEERIDEILLYLLQRHRSVSVYDLESELYISRSTLGSDLKRMREILSGNDLEILRSDNRITIEGTEIHKRSCILERKLMVSNGTFLSHTPEAAQDYIKEIVVKKLVKYRQSISEAELSNLIVLLYVTIRRIQEDFCIMPYDLQIREDLEPEHSLAEEIFRDLGRRFNLRVTPEEVNYLALYFKGQGGYAQPVIREEINTFVIESLAEIKKELGLDFTGNLNLRISLALHCTPLFVRVRYGMQLKNPLKDSIRQSYPQGIDIAAFFADRIYRRIRKRVSDDEIAYLAIYFSSALSEIHSDMPGSHVLIISAARGSENTLMQQILTRWFPTQIAEISFITPGELEKEPDRMDGFDVILTTEKNKYYEMGLAFYVSSFPGSNDRANLRLMLDGFKDPGDVLSIFREDLFYVVEDMSKDMLLRRMCAQISGIYETDGLLEAVRMREDMRSTYFGNGFGVPHPIVPVSSDTFVSVAVSKTPVCWDEEDNMVSLIFLVGIGKNSLQAFQLWNYLSTVFRDKTFTKKLLAEPTYSCLTSLLTKAFSEQF